MIQELKTYLGFEKKVLSENREEVNKYNRQMLLIVLILLICCYGALLVLAFLSEEYAKMTFLYVSSIICAAACLFFVLRLQDMPVYVLCYGMYAIMVFFCIYSSAFLSPESASVYVLVFLLMFPMLFLDISWRINLAECIYSAVYIFIVIQYKASSILFEEIVNVICYTVIAIVLGLFMRTMHLGYLKIQREKQILERKDMLTGLPNHTQLREDLVKRGNPPMALVLLHIEDLLNLGEIYGLDFSDDFLKNLGSLLQSDLISESLTFYCYGERKLIAVAEHNPNESLFQSLATIHTTIRDLKMGGYNGEGKTITFSIGAAYWNSNTPQMIRNAKKAVRFAQVRGKNRIVIYEDVLEQIEEANLE